MNADPAIVRATPLMLDVLAALHEACFEEAWSRGEMARLLAMPGAFALLATAPGADGPVPAGFAMARIAAGEAEILSLGVTPAERRRGDGRRLLHAVLAEAKANGAREAFLEVEAANRPARALYQAAGFVEVGLRANYYRRADGRRLDAVVMRRDLGA